MQCTHNITFQRVKQNKLEEPAFSRLSKVEHMRRVLARHAPSSCKSLLSPVSRLIKHRRPAESGREEKRISFARKYRNIKRRANAKKSPPFLRGECYTNERYLPSSSLCTFAAGFFDMSKIHERKIGETHRGSARNLSLCVRGLLE